MKLVGLDTETHLFYAGNMAPPIVCVTCTDDDGTVLLRREDGLDLIERVLLDEECIIAGSNIAYDFICAAAHRRHLLDLVFKAHDDGRIWDILIGEALHDILFGQLFRDPITLKPFERYSQSLVEQRLLGIDRRDQKHGENVWRMRYGELDMLPTESWPPEAIQYPKDDSYLARECARKQIERGSNAHCMEEQARAALALHLSRVWGIRTDPETVKSVVAEVTAVHVETLRKFTELGIYRPDGTKDTAALAKRVALAYGAKDICTDCHGSGKASSVKTGKPVVCTKCWGTGLDISSVPLTETGRVTTDRDTLQESGDDHLEEFATTGQNEKWFSTYLPVLQLGTERPINAETNVLVATGRTSYRHPNLQNLPRKGRIRECFAARPGHVFGTIDYGGLELVTLAQVCLWWVGHSKLAEALNEGKDVHSLFGAMLLNVSFEEFEHRLHKQKDKQAKSFRQLAKCPNFGLPGGLGAGKLVAYGRQSYGARFCELAGVADKCGENKVIGRDGRPVCSKCLEVATDMRQKWFDFWPEVREYHAIVKRLTEGPNGGDVQVPGPVGPGMPGLGLTRGQCGFCDGANNGFQGLAARGAKAAYYEVTKECYTNRDSPLWGTRPLIFIHDEIIPEIPEARGHEAAYRISEIMVATMKRFTPDVRVTAPPALMKRWFKGAEPVHECRKHGKPEKKWLHEERCCADARLVPWWPK